VVAAELIFRRGTVITVDAEFSLAQAIAISDGSIVAVGRDEHVEHLIGPRTRVVDLDGATVLPGINDSHIHAAMLGAYWPGYWMDAMAGGGGFPAPRDLLTEEDRRAALRRAWDVLLPLGVTSYTEPGLGSGADHQHGGACGAPVLDTYRQLAAEGQLPVRVNVLALFGELDGPCDPDIYAAAVSELTAEESSPERRLRLAGVKIFADGIPPAGSAWMHEPYTDGSTGALLMPGNDHAQRVAVLTAMVGQAHARGLQVGVHATGNATLDATVAAFISAADGDGAFDRRHYVIHADTGSPEVLALMARHGVGLNTQSAIYTATAALLDGTIGRERTERAFPLHTALDAGVAVSLSSDSPVMAPDWRVGIVAAVRRRGPDGVVRGPNEVIGVADAIRAYTIVPAMQDHAESWKGSIEVGKVADLCVLDASPLTVAVDEIPQIGISMTVVNGRIVYEADRSREPTRTATSL
jgi:hypothetical protein